MSGSKVGDMVDRFLRNEAKALGRRVKIRRPKPPPELAYLIEWYEMIRSGMPRGMEVEPISHGEILAFLTLHDLMGDETSFDVQMLRRLDGVWWKARPQPPEPVQPPSGLARRLVGRR